MQAAALVTAALIAIPLLTVAASLLPGAGSQTWAHLADTVLPSYIASTLYLCVGVGVGTVTIGAAAAWLVTMHDFPGRRMFEWSLVLPLAVPTYVMAYTYTDLLQFVGPVQSWLRTTFALAPGSYWFPDIRTLGGAVVVFTLVLYPYVYLLARSAFLERATGMLDVGRSLGLGPWRRFFRIALPLARPAIAAGAALALMETLADYGAVSYFGVQTFTTGIYRAWFSLGDRQAASQLAAALLGFVGLLLLLEHASRGRARFDVSGSRHAGHLGTRLTGPRAAGAILVCSVPLCGGFLVPAGVLLHMAITSGDAQFGERFIELSRNSFVLAATAAILAVAIAVLLAYAARTARGGLTRHVNRLVGLGYALSGTVIAVGVLLPVTRVDIWLASAIMDMTGRNPGLLLTGGIAALVYAYLVRFLAVSLHTVEANLGKITMSMDDAARSLGHGAATTLWRVHLPMLRGSLLTAGLLVFVEVMKELPATLVMRPFNFDTLATQAYTLASDERLTEASTAALAIVAVGVLPLIFLTREIARSRRER
ncbi:iron ABC transporter permease [Massilia psychrophila]|uniref:Iron ABC transporter permease n=1 Tax=Massilia psychrophila TaxID=1603353 RepID=A0A2G8T1P4_9BURK|nr:iron ABC transporter permease [Massilia psychrophila]GGE80431.1 iron(III) ABC transporter permease [Massilia psychrophila]